MLTAADIQIHRHPILLLHRVNQALGVFRVDKSEIVPAGPGPLGHGVRLTPGGLASHWISRRKPIDQIGQRALAGAGGREVRRFG